MPYERSKEEVEQALSRHDYLRQVGGFAMQHTIVSLYSSSTVVSPPDTVVRGRWAAADDDFNGEQLLLNYRSDNARLGFQLGIGRFYEPDAILSSCHADLEEDLRDAIELPKPHAFNVDGLAPGIYEYFPYAHAVKQVVGAAGNAVLSSPDLETTKSGFALTFVYNLYHNSRKYGDSGVVFGLIEVGAILQNLHLARTAVGLAGCDQGSYDKQVIEKALGLDGHTRHVVHVTVVGQGE